MYRANGSVVRTLDVAANSRSEHHSSAAMTSDGRFAVAFVKADDIIVQRYRKDGSLQGYHVAAGGTNLQAEPSVTMDAYGNSIVAWQESVNKNWNVYARTIRSSGTMGSIWTVTASSAQETLPCVAVDSLTGKFVVAYQYDTGTAVSVKVTEMTGSGGYIRSSTVGTGLVDPFVSLGGSGHRYLTVSQSLWSRGDDPDGGVFARFGIL
jgi:hypothetical protein